MPLSHFALDPSPKLPSSSQAKKIIDTRIITRLEDVEVHQPEYREPWSLPMSIFKPRVKEADTRNFLDSEQTEERTFEKDWARACAKEKFTGEGEGQSDWRFL